MRLFYLINSWAGRSEWLDASLRFFYVGAVPFLATALAAMIFLAPRRHQVSRRRVGAATLISLLLCVGVMALVPFFQKQFLGGAPISPRPFMTHWVTSLVVEANDNSFPCFEVMLAAALATLLWATQPAYGVLAWSAVFLLGFSRTFCGMNYLGDSIGGAVLGAGLSTFALALARVRLQLPSLNRSTPRLSWRVRHQGALSVLTIAGFLTFSFISLLNSPSHSAKFRNLWGDTSASASPVAAPGSTPTTTETGNAKVSSAPIPTGIHESEGGVLATQQPGMDAVAPGEMLLSSPVARLDGHLPQAEKLLAQALENLKSPYRIIGVNVAQVKAGTTPYRVAAIRFEVKGEGANERRLVTETCVAFFKRAFQVDAQLQHVDILAMKLGERVLDNDDLSEAAIKARTIHGGARPVFTASIERKDLILKDKPAWTNWYKIDPGMWLRTRSLLYIDKKILPPAPPQPSTPPVISRPIAPITKPTPKPTVKPIAKPLVKPTILKPTIVKSTPKKKFVVKRRATIRRYRNRRDWRKHRAYRSRRTRRNYR